MEEDVVSRKVFVRDITPSYFFWVCTDCMVAYFENDEVIVTNRNGRREDVLCPNKKGVILKKCCNRLLGGEKDYYYKHYKEI